MLPVLAGRLLSQLLSGAQSAAGVDVRLCLDWQKLSLDRAFPFLAQLITQLGCENCPAMHVITENQRSEDSHTPSEGALRAKRSGDRCAAEEV